MNCPNCGTLNDPSNKFCLKCGYSLAVEPVAAAPAPPAYSPPATPKVQQADGWGTTAQPGLAPRPAPPYYPPAPHASAVGPQPYYGASGSAGLNVWGPFAGYGTRRRHVGWLMNAQGHRAGELQAQVEAKFKEREIPGAILYRETLVGRGVFVESRPYFIVRRGLASLALYIAQIGRDLFISQASYIKPPISNFRVIVLLSMLAFQGFMTFLYPASLAGAMDEMGGFGLFGGSSGGMANVLFLTCVLGPLGGLNTLALFALLVFSLFKWLTEKDFWAALRVPPNEFNEDDLMAMEKAVEETVRQSLTTISLNPEDLRTVEVGRGGRIF